MSETLANSKTKVWPKSWAIYIETLVIILLSIFILFLQFGSFELEVLLSYHALLVFAGSLSVWFANRFTLEYIMQSRIEENKITRYLPFELIGASILVTSIIYIIIYLILSYLQESSFVFANFLQGFLGTVALSLLIGALYLGSQVWKSWWSDGEFLFRMIDNGQSQSETKDFLTIKNSRGEVNIDLHDISYLFSESKIVFLVDKSGKKWMTQYNLTELEDSLDDSFFRLNRSILVSRQIISHIQKLPNHRLLVTIDQSHENHKETISRYKSTRFKQWYQSA